MEGKNTKVVCVWGKKQTEGMDVFYFVTVRKDFERGEVLHQDEFFLETTGELESLLLSDGILSSGTNIEHINAP